MAFPERYRSGNGLQILQIREGNVVFQVVPGQVGVDLPIGFGYGAFRVPDLGAGAVCPCDDGISGGFAAFCFALNLRNRRLFVSGMEFRYLRPLHALLCHNITLPKAFLDLSRIMQSIENAGTEK